jgi:hypothetical protein
VTLLSSLRAAAMLRRWTLLQFHATMFRLKETWGTTMKTTVKKAGKKGTRSKTAKEMLRDTKRATTSLKKKTSKTLKKIFG